VQSAFQGVDQARQFEQILQAERRAAKAKQNRRIFRI
jgi:hypothetical protein